ncbi:MAG: hypothetical protein FJ118_07070 [Deltaproteobacteria bacterium]|nr:hypothetical protein [Deltaproteobacteria bacterium]
MSPEEFQEIHVRVVDHFDRVVLGYVREDIRHLLEQIKPDGQGLGSCAVPLAMTVFSAMNFLGALICLKGEPDDTKASIKAFCNRFMSKVNKLYQKETAQEVFIDLFRHGLAHQFLPKACAITRDPRMNEVLGDFPEGTLTLQSDVLAKDFLRAIELLYEKVSKGKNQTLVLQIAQKLDELRQKDDATRGELRGKVERCLTSDLHSLTEYPVTTSGTTPEISGTMTIDPRCLK